MTVEEFSRLVQLEVDKFKDEWVEQGKKNPELYPKALGEADWWDQFVTHLATTNSIKTGR